MFTCRPLQGLDKDTIVGWAESLRTDPCAVRAIENLLNGAEGVEDQYRIAGGGGFLHLWHCSLPLC